MKEKLSITHLWKYLPSIGFMFIFFSLHFFKNRWIGFHENSPWEESFELVSISGYFYNLGIIIWRLIDFGNVFILIPTAFILVFYRERLRFENLKFLLCIIGAIIIVFIIPLASFKYINAHRYFLPFYILISFAFMQFFLQLRMYKMGAILLVLLFFGNFWIYPKTISQGWDVSLGHLPIYKLTYEMNDFILDSDIDPKEVGTEFPLKSDPKYLYLNSSEPGYKEAQIGVDKFILYSKVMNGFKESDINVLKNEYLIRHGILQNKIDLILYEKRSKTEAGRTQ